MGRGGGGGGGGGGVRGICTERKFDESGASPVFSSILRILPVMVTSECVLGLLSLLFGRGDSVIPSNKIPMLALCVVMVQCSLPV